MSKALYQLFKDCTVKLESRNSRGTGFFVATGKILTCAHVVQDITQQKIQAIWKDKTLEIHNVELYDDVDLALLHVDYISHPCVYLDSETLPGDDFYSYGYPDEIQKRNGSSLRVEYEGTADDEKLLIIKGENVRPGFSGAPLLNQRTLKVCGLIKSEKLLETGRVLRALGGYAIPLDEILRYYPSLEEENHSFHEQIHSYETKEPQFNDLTTVNTKDARNLSIRNTWLELIEVSLSSPPRWSKIDILKNFEIASNIGRNWLRTIDNEPIDRPEVKQIIELIEQGSKTILLTDQPGSGKTCVLLDIAECIENQSCAWKLLFIKGDHFSGAKGEDDLVSMGLPENILEQCEILARSFNIVIILDSLDVLSLNRQHNVLKSFLGLIDQLERLEGITVIAACRTFDLDYDPLLRGRSWEHRINLQPLDYDSVICPFLVKWGIEPDEVNTELRELLKLPHNLHLYGKLARLNTRLQPTSAYELCNSFLEEFIVREPQLGNEALNALQDMAIYLMQHRRQSLNKSAFKADENVLRQLCGQEILWETSPGVLEFSHQTLRDCITVRANLAKNKTLKEFILEHPQIPFIRPAVRTFFFYLRAQQPDCFSREVRQVLDHENIAYHVKRLICESLVEITPLDNDWSLIRFIFQKHTDLFKRLLWRLHSKAWFDILQSHWLPHVKLLDDESRRPWLLQFVQHLRTWMNLCPARVIALWKDAINSNWTNKPNLIRAICAGLDGFQKWDTEGVRQLLEVLVEDTHIEREDYLCRSLSLWVQATDSGDDLLWRYITKNVLPEDLYHWYLRDKLRCTPDQFYGDNFLDNRLSQSDVLLDLAINSLKEWSSISSDFLQETSWKFKHSSTGVMHPVDGLSSLLRSVEFSLKHRANHNDNWWQTNEPFLRTAKEEFIQYFMLQVYKENIDTNIIGIKFKLQDKELFEISKLSYELGGLIKMAYPSISDLVRATNQKIILSLHSEKPDYIDESKKLQCSTYKNRKIYEFLIWIPCIFRTQEAQIHIDQWKEHFGDFHPLPDIYTSGGIVMPPLSASNLLNLSDQSLIRLLKYYGQNSSDSLFCHEMIGGFSEVVRVLKDACSLHPNRFLDLFIIFIQEQIHEKYIIAVVEGIANHLIYRFGNCSPSEKWEPIKPLPESTILSIKLLNLVERHPILWKECKVICNALKACCYVLDDYESASRLTLLLFWLRAKDTSIYSETIDTSKHGLTGKAINSVKGMASRASIILCNRLIEKDQPIPELLPYLLSYFAKDKPIFIRVLLFENLHSLIYKNPSLGWQLFDEAFQEPQPYLWQYAERCLYYNYKDNFNLIKLYLDRILEEGIEHNGETWGRISALASLTGHITQSELFESLAKTNDDALLGVTQVFVSNLREYSQICHAGLISISRCENLKEVIFREIESSFSKEKNQAAIKDTLAIALLNSLGSSSDNRDLYHFLEWLAYKAQHDPLSILEIVETLAKILVSKEQTFRVRHTEPLIATLVMILREADDDPDLIHRAIKLQDQFLSLDIGGMEALLTRSARF